MQFEDIKADHERGIVYVCYELHIIMQCSCMDIYMYMYIYVCFPHRVRGVTKRKPGTGRELPAVGAADAAPARPELQ